jgi:DNA-binding NarL/FixJ family response regulator
LANIAYSVNEMDYQGEKEVNMEKRAKILVVDDEPEFAADLQVILEAKDYQVVIAGDRTKAVETVQGDRPDLIILGTIAPRGDGFLLHQWLKNSPGFSGLPIIVVDAPPEKRLLKGWRRDEGMQLGTEDYYCKPINPDALVPQVEKLLDKVTRRIRVLVVDDHTVVREGIHALLSLQRDIQVVGEAVDGREAVEKAGQLLPDVVLMDIVMPGINGLEATQQICRQCKRVKVLMLSQYDEEANVLASDQAGALGFIPKKSASSGLLLAGIRAASRGERFKHPVAA